MFPFLFRGIEAKACGKCLIFEGLLGGLIGAEGAADAGIAAGIGAADAGIGAGIDAGVAGAVDAGVAGAADAGLVGGIGGAAEGGIAAGADAALGVGGAAEGGVAAGADAAFGGAAIGAPESAVGAVGAAAEAPVAGVGSAALAAPTGGFLGPEAALSGEIGPTSALSGGDIFGAAPFSQTGFPSLAAQSVDLGAAPSAGFDAFTGGVAPVSESAIGAPSISGSFLDSSLIPQGADELAGGVSAGESTGAGLPSLASQSVEATTGPLDLSTTPALSANDVVGSDFSNLVPPPAEDNLISGVTPGEQQFTGLNTGGNAITTGANPPPSSFVTDSPVNVQTSAFSPSTSGPPVETGGTADPGVPGSSGSQIAGQGSTVQPAATGEGGGGGGVISPAAAKALGGNNFPIGLAAAAVPLGLLASRFNQTLPPQFGQAEAQAGPAGQFGAQEFSTGGALTPQQQATVDTAYQNLLNQGYQQLASQGITNVQSSSQWQGILANAAAQQNTWVSQYMSANLGNAAAALQISNNALLTAGAQQVAENNALTQALGSAAIGAGLISSIGLKNAA